MKLTHNLYRQILTIVCIIFALIYIIVAVVIPKTLIPFYEKNIYLYLQTPLEVVRNDINLSKIDTSVAFIYKENDLLTTSSNLKKVIDIPAKQIIKKIKKPNGKFTYRGRTYYYSAIKDDNRYKIAITNDEYVRKMRADILEALFPVLIVTLLMILIIVAVWSQSLAGRIKHLKDKIDNLDNDDFIDKYNDKFNDELKVLSNAIDEMKITLHKQDEYKNQMYQNISHDFKTPLTVVKSYIEAIEDGVQDEKTGLKIIKQEIEKLEIKVHSLLYLNKLIYYKNTKDTDNYKHVTVDIVEMLNNSVSKFKVTRPDVQWHLKIYDTKTTFNGSQTMWEAIIDNILSNFIRYADKTIKITVRSHRIYFYNDGQAIDENILDDMFTPYKKGINGQFGLGLSIVKQTLLLLGYDVSIKNEKVGICFIIK